MPGYADVMDPGDEEGHPSGIIAKSIEQAVKELNAEGAVQPLVQIPYVAKLFCGHTVGGTTRMSKVRFGSHGAPCPECGEFQLFVDIVLAQDLTL